MTMANINDLASKIVSRMNQLDSNPNDNNIDATIWKKHALAWGAKDNVTVKISVFRAEKSIKEYLNTQSHKTGKSVDKLAAEWYDGLVEIKSKPENEQPKNVTKHRVSIVSDRFTPKTGTVEETDNVTVATANTPEMKSIPREEKPTLLQSFTNQSGKSLEDCRKSAELHIKQELKRRNLTKSDSQIKYWMEKIAYMTFRYNIPDEILVSIIGRENKFDKNISSGNGNGAMALTTIAIDDMFPNKHWSKTYAMLDKDLHDDIFYRDGNGHIRKNSKGQPVLQYSNSSKVRRACSKDDFSMKVGTLYFEMCYVKALTSKLLHKDYHSVTEPEAQNTIRKLKEGKIDFSKINNEDVVAIALLNYNGHPKHKKNYKTDTMNSLRAQGFNFQEQSIVRA